MLYISMKKPEIKLSMNLLDKNTKFYRVCVCCVVCVNRFQLNELRRKFLWVIVGYLLCIAFIMCIFMHSLLLWGDLTIFMKVTQLPRSLIVSLINFAF